MTGLPDEIRRQAPTLADGRYRVLAQAGEGLLLRRYRVWDERINVMRIVKVLGASFATDTLMRERFVEHYRRLLGFHHASVTRVHDVEPRAVLPWAVVEDHEGLSLHDHVATHGALGPRQTVQAVRPLLGGLQALHAADFVHSDIRLRSLFPNAEQGFVLAEPSLQWAVGAALEALDDQAWTPPERRRDPSLRTPASDLYSFGAVLYALLTGTTPPDFLYELETEDSAFASVPEPFRDVVARCCRLVPGERPRDVRSVVEALTRAARAVGPDSEEASPLPRPPDVVEVPDTFDFPDLQPVLDSASRATTFEADDDDDSVTTQRESVLPYQLPPVAEDGGAEGEAPSSRVDSTAETLPFGQPASGPPAAPDPGSSESSPPAARRSLGKPRPVGHLAASSPEPRREKRVSLTRWVVVGSVAGVLFAGIALFAYTSVLLSASYRLEAAQEATQQSREQLYRTIDAHHSIVAAMDESLYSAYRSWTVVRGEPQRIDAALSFLDGFALTMTIVPRDHPRRAQMEDAARRLTSSRQNYEAALDRWRTNVGSLSGRTAISLGMGRGPPEDQSSASAR